MTDDEVVHEFMSMFVAARSSGTASLATWLSGWRPKKPDERHHVVDQFLLSLTTDQRALVEPAIAHFLDLAFYILLVRLEQGEGPWNFRLNVENRDTGDEVELIGPVARDRDLRSQFQDYVEPKPRT